MNRSIPLFPLLLSLSACGTMPGADARMDVAVRGHEQGTPIEGLMLAGRVMADITSIQLDVLMITANVDDAWVTLSDEPQTIDLIGLEDGTATALNDVLVPAGHYDQMRLVLGDDNFIVADGEMFALRIPSGSQSGVKIPIDATIEEGVDYTLVLKFDLDHNLVHNAQGWKLTPVLHIESLDGDEENDGEGEENENEEEDAPPM